MLDCLIGLILDAPVTGASNGRAIPVEYANCIPPLDSDLTEYYLAFRKAERTRNQPEREAAFVKLVDELFTREIFPTVIWSHTHSPEGMQFRCIWWVRNSFFRLKGLFQSPEQGARNLNSIWIAFIDRLID